MKIKSIFFLVFLFIAIATFGQRDFTATQYMFNTQLYNPAYAGTGEDVNVCAMYKSQWSGMETSPQSQLLTAHMPLNYYRLGLGLSVLNENIYSLHTFSASAAGSYKIKLSKGYLSFGLTAGFRQNSTLPFRQSVKDPNDIYLTNVSYRALFLDNAAGVYYYKKEYALGLSATHLFPTWGNNKALFVPVRHYYLFASKTVSLTSETSIISSLLLRKAAGSPAQADIVCRIINEGIGWVGLGYRTNNELSFLGGIRINNIFSSLRPKLSLGYAYDAPFSNKNLYNKGSHEFMLLADFSILKNPDSIYKTTLHNE